DRHRVPGLAIARVEDCTLSETRTLGIADQTHGTPVSPSTLFEAASLSKPVFAYLFMRAVGRGETGLDTLVADTLRSPRVTDAKGYSALTPRHLLSHRSGLPNWSGRASDPGRTDPLRFEFPPGESFAYSGEGYFMLQRYLEGFREQPLSKVFREELGQKMPQSTFDPAPTEASRAFGHGADGTTHRGRPLSNSPAIAAFSLKTVVEDYGRFLATVCRGSDLPAPIHKEMLRPQSPVAPTHFGADSDVLEKNENAQIAWALGWGVLDHQGRRVHFHWGDNGVFKAFVAFNLHSGSGVVFFANGKNGLELVPAVVEPIVGSMKPVMEWLN
ncbi:MAG: serine hydrolase domain-containing protein, partial [Myxococcota bacterium]